MVKTDDLCKLSPVSKFMFDYFAPHFDGANYYICAVQRRICEPRPTRVSERINPVNLDISACRLVRFPNVLPHENAAQSIVIPTCPSLFDGPGSIADDFSHSYPGMAKRFGSLVLGAISTQ